MTKSQIALLLTACAARDQRTIGETDVLAWSEDLGDLDYDDALQAVSLHYRESTDRIMPAHVRRQCRIIRDKRRAGQNIAAIKASVQPSDEERIRRNKARLAEVMAQIAEKRSVPAVVAEPEMLSESDKIRLRALSMARQSRPQTRRLDSSMQA